MKRYTKSAMSLLTEVPTGEFILYSDHEAALKEAVAKEREACAKLCDAEIKLIPMYRTRAEGIEARRLAAAIRARGVA